MKENIKLTILPNGLRVLTNSVQGVCSAAIGAWIDVGSRYEDIAKESGIAHLTEHMLFKGTENRSAVQIAGEIEATGGNMNAYTGREVTAYTIHGLSENVPQAIDMIADIVQRSTIPDDELALERGVVLQEIKMCHDTPDDLVFDHAYNAAWGNQPLGSPILGSAKSVESITRNQILSYIKRAYRPSSIVLSAAGAIEHNKVVDTAHKFFGDMKNDKGAPMSAEKDPYKGGQKLENKSLEQAHIILGFEGVSRTSPDFWTVKLLSRILGGGMASRLFQEVREKRGLAYSIYSLHQSYADCGFFGIYAGTGEGHTKELLPVICNEVKKMSKTITDAEMSRAKAQMRAGILMSREDMMARADSGANHLLMRNALIDVNAICDKIARVGKNDIANAADKIFSSTPSLAALGCIGQMESYEDILQRLA